MKKQGTASEATLVAMLSARSRITKTLEASLPDYDPAIVTKLVCYSSGVLRLLTLSRCNVFVTK